MRSMEYQDCVRVAQAPDDTRDIDLDIDLDIDRGLRLSDANINPATGLATDYLNRFNEAVMLLEMLSSCPEFRADFLAWKPLSYREHFRASHSKTRDFAIAAYDTADPNIRGSLDTLAVTMTVVLEATRAALKGDLRPDTVTALAENAVGWLKPLIARAGAIINGEAELMDAPSPQAVVDKLMNDRSRV
jgi:hypothetical protein